MRKSVAILGSTGSIGHNTLDVIASHPDKFEVKTLTARVNVEKLIEQARKFKPKYVVVGDQAYYQQTKEVLQDTDIGVLSGIDNIIDVAKQPVDILISAIVGAAALEPTYAAIEAGNNIGLANKECLVCAGDLILQKAQESGSKIIPIDSEHNSLFQLLETQNTSQISSLTLTASGGPFREYSHEMLRNVTPQQAVAHPNWSMGAKISVDSATLMNKGLEAIEAKVLFDAEPDILIHPESIIHGLVNFDDGMTLAALSQPDMRIPISYALGLGKRMTNDAPKLSLADIGSLNFSKPDTKLFPALKLAYNAMQASGNAPIILNAANEIAVQAFLNKEISFLDIAKLVEETLNFDHGINALTIEEIIAIDQKARHYALSLTNKMAA